jgi:hypothetical protein
MTINKILRHFLLIIFNNITVKTLIYQNVNFINYDLHVTDTFFISHLNNI